VREHPTVVIHRAATSFGHVAGAYDRARPDYPAEALSLLVAELGIGPGTTVVDLAAGTGKLTRLLGRTGAQVVAVEPVVGMRDVLAERAPGVEVLDGTAEDMALPDASVDACTVAQAFHWFDGPRALAEIHRVLRPGGRLGLVWNRRDGSQPLQRELDAVFDPLRGDTPAYRSGAWRRAFDVTDRFGPLHDAHMATEQHLDTDALVDHVLSISFVAGLAAPSRAEVADAVRAIAERHGGRVVLRYVTDCYWCQAR
jgi:SAM-dependent methyltransferase